MTAPVASLMRRYNTESIYKEKQAGLPSLLERLVGGSMAFGRAAHNAQQNDRAAQQAVQMNEMLRELELARVDQAGSLLRFTPVPRFAPPDIPPGWDEGMVRLASIAARAGADMAKEGGFDPTTFAKGIGALSKTKAAPLAGKAKNMLTGGLGWKTNLALGGLAAGGLYLGNKALQKGTQVMNEESGPAVYGGGRFGNQLAFGVNQYGQPQLGTPL